MPSRRISRSGFIFTAPYFRPGAPAVPSPPASHLPLPTSHFVVAFLVALAASSPRAGATEPLDVWNPRTSTYGTASEWRGIAFGNGRFVVVSATKGNVITSVTGTDWERAFHRSTKPCTP
jgi:hypothetical protein